MDIHVVVKFRWLMSCDSGFEMAESCEARARQLKIAVTSSASHEISQGTWISLAQANLRRHKQVNISAPEMRDICCLILCKINKRFSNSIFCTIIGYPIIFAQLSCILHNYRAFCANPLISFMLGNDCLPNSRYLHCSTA